MSQTKKKKFEGGNVRKKKHIREPDLNGTRYATAHGRNRGGQKTRKDRIKKVSKSNGLQRAEKKEDANVIHIQYRF